MLYGLKALSKLQQKKFRQEYGIFLVEGKKGVEEAVAAGAEVIGLVASEQFVRQTPEFVHHATIKPFFAKNDVLTLNDTEFSRLADTTTPQGIMAVIQRQPTKLADLTKAKTLVVFEDIRDPGNVGTMIRTADWFGVDGILFIGGADPYQPKVVRASMGSFFHLPMYEVEDIEDDVDLLKDAGFTIIVTRPEKTEQLLPLDPKQKICVVFGNESHGTSAQIDQLADRSFTIPKFGNAESLNVAVSFGVALYALKMAV